MKTSLALVAALLAGTAAGAAIASTTDVADMLGRGEHHAARAEASDDASFRVAGDHRRDRDRDHHGRKHHRDHHDDDDDDDDDRGGRGDAGGEGRGGRMPTTGPTDPTTPVPDNGLFQGKARPKVEVN